MSDIELCRPSLRPEIIRILRHTVNANIDAGTDSARGQMIGAAAESLAPRVAR